jgi:hypothetical protein
MTMKPHRVGRAYIKDSIPTARRFHDLPPRRESIAGPLARIRELS